MSDDIADLLKIPPYIVKSSTVEGTSDDFNIIIKSLKQKRENYWDDIVDIVQNSDKRLLVSQCNSDNESFMNIILQHDPPLELIQLIIEAYPECLHQQRQQLSKSNRITPISLFYAVKLNARSEVVRAIIKGDL